MKNESKNLWIKTGGGLASLAVVAVIIVAANVILGSARLRVDLTQDKLYTLSDGTQALLGKLDTPVTLKLFFSRSSPTMPSQIKTYARMVEDVLHEYRAYSKGHITIETCDPKPDSDEEDWAQRYGLAGQQVDMFSPPVFFGLVAVSGAAEAAIPAFDPNQQELLEYTITRLIYRVTHPEKPVIGVISSLPVMGGRAPQNFGMPPPQQQQGPWVALQMLQQDYTVREVDTSAAAIDPDIRTLLVIHPKDLDDKTLYAIDQFVLGGGHLLLMLDPLSIADDSSAMMGGMMGMQQQQRSSNAERLLGAWGISFNAEQAVADVEAATSIRMQNNQVERNLTVLSMSTNNISRKDVLTTQLDAMTLAYAGSFKDDTGSKLTVTPLLYSSDNAGPVSAMSAQFGGTAIEREYKDSPTRLNIALRLNGDFKTAFPAGAPRSAGDTNAPPVAAAAGLTNGTSTVILVGDTDLIFDPICVEEVNVFGFRQQRERNDNLSFFANAVEMLTGSQDLVSVRSRARFNRPFTRVLSLQAKAAEAWRGREMQLEDKLRETERQLQEMQSGKDASQKFILSNEEKVTIDNFRAEEARTKKELKDVRKNLRGEIDRLGMKVKVLNIALMPALVALTGVGYGVYRRRRETARRVKAAA